MKKAIFALVIFTIVGVTNGFGQNEKAKMEMKTTMSMASFGVRGNCGMCKKVIEKAANSVDGVSKADWNVKNKSIMISYDESMTSPMAVHKAIAESGYDTERMMGNKDAYNNLPGCCKYDHEMKMNQGKAKKVETHKNHKH